jgi:hypothetical protein
MRRFQIFDYDPENRDTLHRVAADGVIFPSGKAAVAWRGAHASVVVWDSFADAVAVHCGVGKRGVRWVDPPC